MTNHDNATPAARFSVIVPTYNVQAWIRDCLESLRSQTFGDFEVLVIDDRGTDRSIAIASEFLDDPRFRIVEMPSNQGLGAARNRGIAEARGDYLLFLDSDDMLRDDALEILDEEFIQRPEADLVMFDYSRLTWQGDSFQSSNKDLLTLHRGKLVDVDTVPELLRVFNISTNKAYNRRWLVELGLQFYPGFYEDVAWTYPVMMSARSMSLVPEPLYIYRQRFEGSILSTQSSRHLELFDQYERMLDDVSQLPNFDLHRALLFDRMVFHIRSLVRADLDRIPSANKREFYARSSKVIAQYRHLQAPNTPRQIRLRTRILGSRAWPIFPVLKSASRRLGRLRIQTWRRASKVVHGAAVRLPQRQPTAVYMSYWGQSQTGNPHALYAAHRRLRPDVKAYVVLEGPAADDTPSSAIIRPGTLRERWVLGRATHAVSDVNFPGWMQKRRGAIHLQTQHGTPLKAMGVHVLGTQSAPASGLRGLLDRCARWDYCLSSNAFSTEIWPAAFPVSFQVLETGYPRNDCLKDREFVENARQSVRQAYGIPAGARLLLYAPTFREYEADYVSHIDWSNVLDQLDEDTYVMVRSHHSYRLPDHDVQGRIVNGSAHRLIEELYATADVLVTDYSSAMFDFANLLRPIVLFLDDYAVYSEYRGMYFDIREDLPSTVVDNETSLVRLLATHDYAEEGPRQEVERFAEKFCSLDDGRSSARVLSVLFDD